MTVFRTALALALCVVLVGPARADAPLVTDNAETIPSKTCQLESFVYAQSSSRQYAAVPACNLGRLELSVGWAAVNPDGTPSGQQWGGQAKITLAGDQSEGWAVGALAGAGVASRSLVDDARRTRYFGKALASFWPVESVEIDVNLGAASDYGTAGTAVGGVAAQWFFVPRWSAFIEGFRDARGPGKGQAGLTFDVVPERLALYASYGRQLGSATGTAWTVLGLRVNTAPILP
jgi:hypothetical protein